MLCLNNVIPRCPDCSVCSKTYSASLGFACNKCSDNAGGGIALVVSMGVVFVLAFAAFLSYMLSGETRGAGQSIVARVTRFFPLQSVKIVIVVWQILTQVRCTATVFQRRWHHTLFYERNEPMKSFGLGYVRKSSCFVLLLMGYILICCCVLASLLELNLERYSV